MYLVGFVSDFETNKFIQKESICRRLGDNSNDSPYHVTALKEINGVKKRMYRVKYDMLKKEADVDCACDKGTKYNKFFVNVYEFGRKTTVSRPLKCMCDAKLDDGVKDERFEGHSGLVNYMQKQSGEHNTRVFRGYE